MKRLFITSALFILSTVAANAQKVELAHFTHGKPEAKSIVAELEAKEKKVQLKAQHQLDIEKKGNPHKGNKHKMESKDVLLEKP